MLAVLFILLTGGDDMLFNSVQNGLTYAKWIKSLESVLDVLDLLSF